MHTATLTRTSLVTLLHALETRDGYTYDPRTAQLATTGYAVGVAPRESLTIPADDDTRAEQVAGWFIAHTDAWSTRDRCIGGWVDSRDGSTVLDLVAVVDDLDTALDLARLHDQAAIYHLDTESEIWVAWFDVVTVSSAPTRENRWETITTHIVRDGLGAKVGKVQTRKLHKRGAASVTHVVHCVGRALPCTTFPTVTAAVLAIRPGARVIFDD
jgi:hypothetical protein